MLWRLVKQMFALLLTIFLSWVVIHFFAFLGVFFVIAYPIWVLLNPTKETSLVTLLGGEKRNSQKEQNFQGKRPKKQRIGLSILLNVLLIVCMTVISMSVVYGEKLLLEKSGLLTPKQTAQVDIPLENEYKIGEMFVMPIEVSGLEVPINTVQVDIKYPPELVQIIDFLTVDSFADIFIQKEVRNDLGIARLSGGLPNPGYTEEAGLFAKVLFVTKNPGLGEIEILPSTIVIANDKKGTNVLAQFNSSSIRVTEEEISKAEEDFQKNFLDSNVLGVTSGKLEFFEKEILPLESILGAEDDIKETFKFDFWEILHLIDSKIIDWLFSRIFTS